MKKIMAILLLFLPVVGFCDNFNEYLLYTNKAETFLIQDNYKRAQICYDIAFHSWNKPFAIDIFNSLKCANLNRDYPKVKSLAVRLISLGCELSFFDDPDYLTGFRTSKEWRSLINEYPNIREKYIRNNSWKLRGQIEQIQAKDQFLRRQNPNYTFLRDSIYKEDDTIKIELLQLFKHKFPNEYNYGVFLKDDTTLMDYEPLHIILLHNYGKFDTSQVHNANMHTYDFTQILMDAVKKGDMHPEEFALLNDRSGEFMTCGGYGQMSLLTKIKGKLYYDNYAQKANDKFEKNRKEIGLCTQQEGREKLIYDKKKNINKFILRKSTFGIVFWGDDMFSEKMIRNLFIDTGVTIDKL
jgi:hypothetical protein